MNTSPQVKPSSEPSQLDLPTVNHPHFWLFAWWNARQQWHALDELIASLYCDETRPSAALHNGLSHAQIGALTDERDAIHLATVQGVLPYAWEKSTIFSNHANVHCVTDVTGWEATP